MLLYISGRDILNPAVPPALKLNIIAILELGIRTINIKHYQIFYIKVNNYNVSNFNKTCI
jgi:hypothetical protein